MANGVIGYGDLVGTAAISSSGTVGNLYAANAASQQLGIVAGLASTTGSLSVVFPASAQARLFVVQLVGALATDSVTLLASSTTDPALGDVANLVLPAVDPAIGRTFLLLPTATAVRSARLVFATTYAPRIGRFWIGSALQPTYNFAPGYSAGADSGSVNVQTPISGARWSDSRYISDVIEVQHQYLTEAEVAITRQIRRTVGTTGQCVWIPDPEAADAVSQVVIGYMRDLDPIVLPDYLAGPGGTPLYTKRWRFQGDN